MRKIRDKIVMQVLTDAALKIQPRNKKAVSLGPLQGCIETDIILSLA
jgi:hypothetical protein